MPVREHFWMNADRRRLALAQLARAEGVEEAAVLATCERTEFVLWAQDASLAASSVLSFFTRAYALRSSEWKCFYRRVDEHALIHLLQVASGLDSMVWGDPQVLSDMKSAWTEAQAAGACGTSLDAAFDRTLDVAARVRAESGLGTSQMSVPLATVELARQIFGSLSKRRVLVLGAGRIAERTVHHLLGNGANVRILNRTQERAAQLAAVLGVACCPMRDLGKNLAQADVVISATSAAEFVLQSAEVESASRQRRERPLLLIDLGMPRTVDPAVREFPDVFLYDLDGLQPVLARAAGDRGHEGQAEAAIASEARDFCSKLESQRVMPMVVSLRQKLDEICRQEMELFRHEPGLFSDGHAVEEFAYRISRRLARSLARELKDHPAEQEQLTALVERLFRREAQAPMAGAKS